MSIRKRLVSSMLALACSLSTIVLPIAEGLPARAVSINDESSTTIEDIKATQAFLMNYGYAGSGDVKDMNGDGVVNVIDLSLAKRAYLNSGAVSLLNFQSETYDIYLDTEETVTFTVEVNSNKPLGDKALAVYDEDDKLLSYMHDDGENGDSEADDGVYSAQVTLSSSERKLVDYYAATSTVKSDTHRICFYSDFTEEEFKNFAVIMKDVSEMTFEEAYDYFKNSDAIDNYGVDEDLHKIIYVSADGIPGIWSEPFVDGTLGTAPLNVKDYKIIYSSLIDKNGLGALYKRIDSDAQKILDSNDYFPMHPNRTDVLVVRPYKEEITYEDFPVCGQFVANALGGNLTCMDENVTVESLKEQSAKMQNVGVVLWNGHGANVGKACYPIHYEKKKDTYTIGKGTLDGKTFACGFNCLFTNEHFNVDWFLSGKDAEEHNYDTVHSLYYDIYRDRSADLQDGSIVIVNAGDVVITGRFFEKYYTNLEDTLWYFGACSSMYKMGRDSIAEALTKNGNRRNAVIGFSDTVSESYANVCLWEIVLNQMIFGQNSLKETFNNLNDTIGKEDTLEYHSKFKEDGTPWSNALLRKRGNDEFRLVECNGTITGNVYEKSTQLPAFEILSYTALHDILDNGGKGFYDGETGEYYQNYQMANAEIELYQYDANGNCTSEFNLPFMTTSTDYSADQAYAFENVPIGYMDDNGRFRFYDYEIKANLSTGIWSLQTVSETEYVALENRGLDEYKPFADGQKFKINKQSGTHHKAILAELAVGILCQKIFNSETVKDVKAEIIDDDITRHDTNRLKLDVQGEETDDINENLLHVSGIGIDVVRNDNEEDVTRCNRPDTYSLFEPDNYEVSSCDVNGWTRSEWDENATKWLCTSVDGDLGLRNARDNTIFAYPQDGKKITAGKRTYVFLQAKQVNMVGGWH